MNPINQKNRILAGSKTTLAAIILSSLLFVQCKKDDSIRPAAIPDKGQLQTPPIDVRDKSRHSEKAIQPEFKVIHKYQGEKKYLRYAK